jgi:hypothetical protein
MGKRRVGCSCTVVLVAEPLAAPGQRQLHLPTDIQSGAKGERTGVSVTAMTLPIVDDRALGTMH